MARKPIDITGSEQSAPVTAAETEVPQAPVADNYVQAELVDVTKLLRKLADEYEAAHWFYSAEVTDLLPTKTGNGNMVRVRLHRPGLQFDQTTYISFWRDAKGNLTAQQGWDTVRGEDGKAIKDANGRNQLKTSEFPGVVISGSTNFGSKKGDGTWFPNMRLVVSLAEALVKRAIKKGIIGIA
jgi:hypothetical protein